MDRAHGFGPWGWGFDSLQARFAPPLAGLSATFDFPSNVAQRIKFMGQIRACENLVLNEVKGR